MTSSLRPNIDVIKLSLPYSTKNDSKISNGIVEIDSRFKPLAKDVRPQSASKTRNGNMFVKTALQLGSPTLSTATTMAASKFQSNASPSPKKKGNNTHRSSMSGQLSPNSTCEFTRAPTQLFSRGQTFQQDRISINIKDLMSLNHTQLSQKIPKSPQSKTQKIQEVPAQTVPEAEPELTDAEINDRMYKVFQFYASFGERCNVGYLKSHRFSKMMVDAEIRDDLLPQSSLDLLYAGELRKAGNLDFDHFISLLKRVAKAKFDGEILNIHDAYNVILKEYMLPLYERIFKDDKMFEEETKAASEPLEVSTVMALQLVEESLEQIFRTYFGWELQSTNDQQALRQRLENALFMFLREFQITPSQISKGAAYTLYTNIMREAVPEEPNMSSNSSQSGTPVPEKQTKSNKRKEQEKERDRNLPFGFDRFKLFLVRMGNMAYQAPFGADGEIVVSRHPQMDRTLQLLERMDVAHRTLSPEKKGSQLLSNGKSASLLVAQDSVDKIVTHLRSKEKVVIVRANSVVVIAPGKRGVLITSGTKYEEYNIEDEDVIEVMEKYHDSINNIFQFYCSYGEPMNNNKLHAHKFIKLLREAGLVEAPLSESSFKILEGLPQAPNALTIAEADVIVATLTGPKQVREINEKRFPHDPTIASPWIGHLNSLYRSTCLNFSVQNILEFETFLKAIELVAAKLLPEAKTLGKAVTNILEKFIIKLEKEVEQAKKSKTSQPLKLLVDLLQDFEMVEFLGVVHKSMMLYYKYYSDAKGMMNLEQWVKFCKDFSIFPDILTKNKVCVFFNALAGVRCQAEESDALTASEPTLKIKNIKASELPEVDLIDEHMFIEAIALVAMEIPYLDPQPSEIQKVSNFLEKLNSSNGPVTVRLDMGITRYNNGPQWDIVGDIRQKYPELFILPEDEEDKPNVELLLEESLRK